MPLRRGPKLTEVVDLAQVHAEVPAHAERERDDVLGERGPEVAPKRLVRAGRVLDRRAEPGRHAEVLQVGRQVEPERRAEQLTLLREHAVAVKVAVGREVRDDLELVLRMLERTGRALAPV